MQRGQTACGYFVVSGPARKPPRIGVDWSSLSRKRGSDKGCSSAFLLLSRTPEPDHSQPDVDMNQFKEQTGTVSETLFPALSSDKIMSSV